MAPEKIDHLWLTKSLFIELLIQAKNEGLKEAVEKAVEKIQCFDPGHDKRWCKTCSDYNHAQAIIECRIMSLIKTVKTEEGK